VTARTAAAEAEKGGDGDGSMEVATERLRENLSSGESVNLVREAGNGGGGAKRKDEEVSAVVAFVFQVE
jgi:hypothetical protein